MSICKDPREVHLSRVNIVVIIIKFVIIESAKVVYKPKNIWFSAVSGPIGIPVNWQKNVSTQGKVTIV